jgi:hypothetical protein
MEDVLEVEVIVVVTDWNIAEHPDVDPYVTLHRTFGQCDRAQQGGLAGTHLPGIANHDCAEQGHGADA